MRSRYGPWSSAHGDGISPHLSTFWRRRLQLLSTARAARPGLSRRDCLKLGAAGAAFLALPTLRSSSAVGPSADGEADPGTIFVQGLFPVGPNNARADGLFAVDPETGSMIDLLEFNGQVRASRDGGTLALVHFARNPDGEVDDPGVWAFDATGEGELRRVADFGGVTSWSPDGAQLIVTKWLSKPEDDDMRCETWRFNRDGSGATKLPIPETEAVNDWSPDGDWLVTGSDRDDPQSSGYQLYLMRPDGTDERRLTEGGGLNLFPRFSPDGRQIAYLHSEGGESSLWVVNIDGNGRRLLIQEEHDTSPEQFCWSPNGASLAYQLRIWSRDEDGKKFISGAIDSNHRIAILDLQSGTSRPLGLPHADYINSFDWK